MINTPITKTFQERLEDLYDEHKKKYNLTYTKLSTATGISRAAITKYMSDNAEIGINHLVKLANYFNVSTDYLLGLAPEPTVDKDENAVCEYIGLSLAAVRKLCEISKKNHATANSDTISLLVEDDDFAYFLDLLSGKMCADENKDISFRVGNAQTLIHSFDMADYSITHTITDITDRMKNKFNARFSTVDERNNYFAQKLLYQFVENVYQEGRITNEEYEKVIEEYSKGNFDYGLQRKV